MSILPSVCPYVHQFVCRSTRMSVCPSGLEGNLIFSAPNRGIISSSFAAYGCCHYFFFTNIIESFMSVCIYSATVFIAILQKSSLNAFLIIGECGGYQRQRPRLWGTGVPQWGQGIRGRWLYRYNRQSYGSWFRYGFIDLKRIGHIIMVELSYRIKTLDCQLMKQFKSLATL